MLDNLRADLNRIVKAEGDSRPTLTKAVFRLGVTYGWQAIAVYRLGHYIRSSLRRPLLWPVLLIGEGVYRCLHFAVRNLYGIHIDRRAVIGKGFKIGHFGRVLIGPCAIGEHCNIHQQVRIGESALLGKGRGPIIGNRVWIGAHSVIDGEIVLKDGASVASGSVVGSDVNARTLVMGNPARVVKGNFDNTFLLEPGLRPGRFGGPDRTDL